MKLKFKPPEERVDPIRAIRGLLHLEINTITQLQGSPEGSILIIAPPPGEEEVRKNLVCTGPVAKILMRLLQEAGCDLSKVIMIPTCFMQPRNPRRVSAKEATSSVMIKDLLLNMGHINRVVAVGSEAYRHHFGFGERPPAATLWCSVTAGPQSLNIPLLTLPDLSSLTLNPRMRLTREERRDLEMVMNALHKHRPRIADFFREETE